MGASVEPETKIDWYASPTQLDFILSGAHEVCLMGPRGEGKTEAAIMAMVAHAEQQDPSALPVQWAIFRDTYKNVVRTTIPSFLSSPIKKNIKYRKSDQVIELPGYFTIQLFGVDDLGDLSIFQSLQLGGVWAEEVAPAAVDDIGSGIAEEAWLLALTCLRQKGITPRAQITCNYPNEEHWSWVRFSTTPAPGTELFEIDRGENVNLPAAYRPKMEQALSSRPDLARRLVFGLPGFVQKGVAVTPEFEEKRHVALQELLPIAGVPLELWWDWGLNPTCIFTQISPKGQRRIYDVVVGKNVGVEQIIDSDITPLLSGKYRGLRVDDHIGDPAGSIREQSNSQNTAVQAVLAAIGGDFIPGPVAWSARRDAVKSYLNAGLGEHGPAVIICPRYGKSLIRALRGGWHYRRSNTGAVLRERAVKDIDSHPGDAFGYGVAVRHGTPGLRVKRHDRVTMRDPGYGDQSVISVPTDALEISYGVK